MNKSSLLNTRPFVTGSTKHCSSLFTQSPAELDDWTVEKQKSVYVDGHLKLHMVHNVQSKGFQPPTCTHLSCIHAAWYNQKHVFGYSSPTFACICNNESQTLTAVFYGRGCILKSDTLKPQFIVGSISVQVYMLTQRCLLGTALTACTKIIHNSLCIFSLWRQSHNYSSTWHSSMFPVNHACN